jgi:hypothetical protein
MGFEGAFSYPQETAAVPVPVKPKDDGHFINLLDAFGYGVAAVVPVGKEEGEEEPQIVGWHGREPVFSTKKESDTVGWSETRRRR